MINQQIADFAKQQLASGYTPEQVRAYLIQYGYNAQDVDETLASLSSGKTELEGYITQQLSLGYDVPAIKNFLIQRGYAQDLIEQSFKNITPAKGVNKNVIIIALVVLGLFFVGAIAFLSLGGDDEPTTTFNSVTSQRIATTTTRPPLVTTTLLGASTTRGSISTTTQGLETTTTIVTTTTIPTASSPETATVSEINNEVKNLATYDEEAAVAYCNKISRSTYIDMCFDTLSKTVQDKKYCAMIQGTRKKDSCYVSFITNSDNPDFEACDFITSASLKRSCDAMKSSKTQVSDDKTPKITGIPDINVNTNEETVVQLDNYVTLKDVVWTTSGNDKVVVNINTNGDATIRAEIDWSGFENVQFTACVDTYCDSDTVKISVIKVGGFTLNTIPALSMMKDSDTEINLKDYTDSTETISWSFSDVSNIALNVNDNILIINALGGFVGSESATITGCVNGDCDSTELLVTITDQVDFLFNDIEDVFMNKNDIHNTIELVSYVDTGNLSFSSSSPEHLSIIIDSISTFVNITPESDWAGSETVVFSACDKNDFCLEQEVQVTVI